MRRHLHLAVVLGLVLVACTGLESLSRLRIAAHVAAVEAADGRVRPEGLRFIANPFEARLFAQAPAAAPVRLVAPYRVTVGGTAVQLTSSGNVNGGVVVKAICPGQTMYIGISGVTTATGYPLSDGEAVALGVGNANQIYAIASAAAQSVAVLPFSRY